MANGDSSSDQPRPSSNIAVSHGGVTGCYGQVNNGSDTTWPIQFQNAQQQQYPQHPQRPNQQVRHLQSLELRPVFPGPPLPLPRSNDLLQQHLSSQGCFDMTSTIQTSQLGSHHSDYQQWSTHPVQTFLPSAQRESHVWPTSSSSHADKLGLGHAQSEEPVLGSSSGAHVDMSNADTYPFNARTFGSTNEEPQRHVVGRVPPSPFVAAQIVQNVHTTSELQQSDYHRSPPGASHAFKSQHDVRPPVLNAEVNSHQYVSSNQRLSWDAELCPKEVDVHSCATQNAHSSAHRPQAKNATKINNPPSVYCGLQQLSGLHPSPTRTADVAARLSSSVANTTGSEKDGPPPFLFSVPQMTHDNLDPMCRLSDVPVQTIADHSNQLSTVRSAVCSQSSMSLVDSLSVQPPSPAAGSIRCRDSDLDLTLQRSPPSQMSEETQSKLHLEVCSVPFPACSPLHQDQIDVGSKSSQVDYQQLSHGVGEAGPISESPTVSAPMFLIHSETAVEEMTKMPGANGSSLEDLYLNNVSDAQGQQQTAAVPPAVFCTSQHFPDSSATDKADAGRAHGFTKDLPATNATDSNTTQLIELLKRGRGEESLVTAMDTGEWAHALLLSHLLGPQTVQKTVQAFVESLLTSSTNLQDMVPVASLYLAAHDCSPIRLDAYIKDPQEGDTLVERARRLMTMYLGTQRTSVRVAIDSLSVNPIPPPVEPASQNGIVASTQRLQKAPIVPPRPLATNAAPQDETRYHSGASQLRHMSTSHGIEPAERTTRTEVSDEAAQSTLPDSLLVGAVSWVGGLIKKAVGPEEKNMPAENNFYYDNQANRWRFPGDEGYETKDTSTTKPNTEVRPPPQPTHLGPTSYGNPLVSSGRTDVRDRYVDVFAST